MSDGSRRSGLGHDEPSGADRVEETLERVPDDLPDEVLKELEEDVAKLEQVSFADATPGTREDTRAFWRAAIFIVALALSVFHLWTGWRGLRPTLQQGSFHLGLGLALIFLLYPAKTDMTPKEAVRGWLMSLGAAILLVVMYMTGVAGAHIVVPAAGVLVLVQAARHLPVRIAGMPVADILLSLTGGGAGLYIFFNWEQITRRVAQEANFDLGVATVGVLLILLATQRVIGTPLVVVAVAMLLFAYFGPQMPGFLTHAGFSVDRIAATSFLGTEAVFGTPIQVSSRFIYLFMIFAALLHRTGMERFFTQFAFGLTGWMTGGTAKVAVLTSAFSGTITGSSVANTVSNGAFTIPMMKKSGFKAEFAGAVEAASSTGGQFAPPIMGAAAFIMIEFTGLGLWDIIRAAAIPALLFFTAQYIVIHYESKRLGIGGLPKAELPKVPRLLLNKGYLVIPIIVIFAILAMGFTAMRAAMMAIVATVILNVVVQIIAAMFGKWEDLEDKLTIKNTLDALVGAARIALPIIAATAAAGLIVGVVTLTGLGLFLSTGLIRLAGETLLLTMLFTMVASLVLGIGLPTTANYVITATVAAPALLFFDAVPVIAAHMFVFYFGVMADITPPVCLASYAASGIAQSNPLRTGIQSVRIAIGGFLVPYMFVLSPELLLVDATWFTGVKAALTALIGIFCIGTAVVGYIERRINGYVRGLLAATGLLLLQAELATDLFGLTVFLAIFAWQWWTGPRGRRFAERRRRVAA